MVLATPWYVAKLGLDGYGLVGLWLVLQVMMGLLDAGMGATVVRAFAGAVADREGKQFKRDVLRTLEVCYAGGAVLLAAGLALGAGWVAEHWLKSDALPSEQLAWTLRLMALALACQFPASLYSNGLAGLQEHGRMNGLQMTGNALRYGGGVAILFWKADLLWFFAVQAAVALLQTIATRQHLWMRLRDAERSPAAFNSAILRRLWRFSAGMAATAIAAVLMANADRIALSALLPTTELGKYSVAYTATGLLQLGIQPFYRAFFPRYSELIAANDGERLRHEYFRSCRLLAGLIIPLGITGCAFAPSLLFAWLGSTDATIVLVFRWLLIGITCAGLMWLPAAFQQANGWTRLHASMIGGALLVGAPVMVFAIRSVGTVGATAVWVLHGVSGLTLGLWLMHRRLLVGRLLEWYRTVLVPPLLVTVPLVALATWQMPDGIGRWAGLCWAGTTGAIAVLGALYPEFQRLRHSARSNSMTKLNERT